MSGAATDRLSWDRDGVDWPHRECSQFVDAAGLRWHVQRMGQGPALLLLHGTGAATHSWRGLAPLLARDFTLLAPDLPGHGFTDALPRERLSLSGMARALSQLLQTLGFQPGIVVGHSAGAAIGAQMCLEGQITPRVLVSLNGALLPPMGLPGLFFSPTARLVASSSLVPKLFAWRASSRTAVERLIASTGSTLEPQGIELYARLVRNVGHVSGVLDMMAHWDLAPLERQLGKLGPRLVLAVGGRDRTVSPREAQRVRSLRPTAEIRELPGLGHLAHEEDPARVAELIREFAAAAPT